MTPLLLQDIRVFWGLNLADWKNAPQIAKIIYNKYTVKTFHHMKHKHRIKSKEARHACRLLGASGFGFPGNSGIPA